MLTNSTNYFVYPLLQSSCKTNSSAENTPRSDKQGNQKSEDSSKRTDQERFYNHEKGTSQSFNREEHHHSSVGDGSEIGQSKSTYSDLMNTLKALEDDEHDNERRFQSSNNPRKDYIHNRELFILILVCLVW